MLFHISFFYSCIPRQIPFYIGTIVPVLVIYLFNCVLFVIIFASLIKKSRQSKSKKSDESGGNGNYQLVKQQFIAALSLAVLFGLGWGFGFIATSALNSVEPTLRHIMQILFILFTSFQGLFVFLSTPIFCVTSYFAACWPEPVSNLCEALTMVVAGSQITYGFKHTCMVGLSGKSSSVLLNYAGLISIHCALQ